MKSYFIPFLCFLTACQFHPLYKAQIQQNVCVSSIPETSGYQLYQALKSYFPQQQDCSYILQVQSPVLSLSDQSISNDDFITMQRVTAQTSYSLLDKNKKSVLKNTVSASSSSSVVTNPYASVTAVQKTNENLYPILAEQIALHVGAYLDKVLVQ